MALTDAQNLLQPKANDKSIEMKINGSGTEIQYGALLEITSNKGVPLSGAGTFGGISAVNTDADTIGTVWEEIEIDELEIAGSPAVGEDVYCATDDYGDLTQTSGTNAKVGTIIRASLTAADKWTVRFKAAWNQ